MDLITNRSTRVARFAVNRVYQPARIEHELLAQVFDLVERGGNKAFDANDCCDARPEPVVIALGDRSTAPVAASIVSTDNQSQIIESEKVA